MAPHPAPGAPPPPPSQRSAGRRATAWQQHVVVVAPPLHSLSLHLLASLAVSACARQRCSTRQTSAGVLIELPIRGCGDTTWRAVQEECFRADGLCRHLRAYRQLNRAELRRGSGCMQCSPACRLMVVPDGWVPVTWKLRGLVLGNAAVQASLKTSSAICRANFC